MTLDSLDPFFVTTLGAHGIPAQRSECNTHVTTVFIEGKLSTIEQLYNPQNYEYMQEVVRKLVLPVASSHGSLA